MRILVVGDKACYLKSIYKTLSKENHLVDERQDEENGLNSALSGIYDAAVIDLINGVEFVQKLRTANNSLPVLLLSAKFSVNNRVAGLDRGADYCLAKPYDEKALAACIRALMRRQGVITAENLSFRDLFLGTKSCVLKTKEFSIRLNNKEFELFRLLLLYKGSIVAKETLLLQWGYDIHIEANIVETYTSFLRKKLKTIHSTIQIENIWKQGYYLKSDTFHLSHFP